MMFARFFVLALTLLLGMLPAYALSPLPPGLESAQLVVHPGVADFGFTVGQLFQCMLKAPTHPRITAVRRNESGYTVQMETTRLTPTTMKAEYSFIVTGQTAQLVRAYLENGSYKDVIVNADRMHEMVVDAIAHSCQ